MAPAGVQALRSILEERDRMRTDSQGNVSLFLASEHLLAAADVAFAPALRCGSPSLLRMPVHIQSDLLVL